MARIHDMADTWNDAGTVFTAIKMNVTDTASHDDSLLMDLQVGGVSKFAFLKRSRIKHTEPLTFQYDGSGVMQINEWNQGLCLTALGQLTWSSSNAPSYTSPGVVLLRESNGILAQRNGTNPQEFRIYNTYTDASNYERGFMRWNSDVLEIGAEADGTGSSQRKVDYKISSQSGIRGGTADWRDITFYNPSWSLNFDLSAYAITPSAGVDLGKTTAPFQDIYLKPSSSLTPNANGDLCIEATDNTTLTFKLKGSDGTVRSGTVTLA
jgi:hypothetical protein